ncbi:MAG TPA: hypothetical protein VK522_23435 [Pseudolabrys sp.]|nr:hypothetical protein [Pseudolabrys sp.]
MANRDGLPILITGKKSNELVPVELAGKASVFDEAWIQNLVFDHPATIPMRQIEPGFGTLVSVCRELPTAHGFIDNLIMTSAGDIVIVEAKLWRNPQARREVVAQALDYASCLFRMSYEEFERSIQKTDFGTSPSPKALYELFSSLPDVPREQDFIDAVSTNLARGSIVVIVLGDGIRNEVKLLADALQSHAGFHFTFALVELSVFQTPDGGLLIIPGVIAKTEMIERGIVRFQEGKLSIEEPLRRADEKARPGSISAEKFFDAMRSLNTAIPEKLKRFIDRLDTIGVNPEYQKSLNLKWDPPSGKPVNLGYITPSGAIWTDAVNWSVPHTLSHRYVEDLAKQLGGEVNKKSPQGNYFVTVRGHAPKIVDEIDKFDLWFEAADRFVASLKEKEAL